jgi:hypothetical protein
MFLEAFSVLKVLMYFYLFEHLGNETGKEEN